MGIRITSPLQEISPHNSKRGNYENLLLEQGSTAHWAAMLRWADPTYRRFHRTQAARETRMNNKTRTAPKEPDVSFSCQAVLFERWVSDQLRSEQENLIRSDQIKTSKPCPNPKLKGPEISSRPINYREWRVGEKALSRSSSLPLCAQAEQLEPKWHTFRGFSKLNIKYFKREIGSVSQVNLKYK